MANSKAIAVRLQKGLHGLQTMPPENLDPGDHDPASAQVISSGVVLVNPARGCKNMRAWIWPGNVPLAPPLSPALSWSPTIIEWSGRGRNRWRLPSRQGGDSWTHFTTGLYDPDIRSVTITAVPPDSRCNIAKKRPGAPNRGDLPCRPRPVFVARAIQSCPGSR